MSQFYADSDGTGPSIVNLCGEENSLGSVKLKISGRKMLITFSGEPPGHLLLELLQDSIARGLLTPGMQTLVDMTGFFGVVDWTSLMKLREQSWRTNDGHPPRTAYLLRENGAAILVKAASALFPDSEHRIFSERAAAIAWLES